MTNEEKELLVAYLIDAGDIDPDGDVEVQFMDWYQGPRRHGTRRDALQGHPRGLPGAGRSYTAGATVTRTTSPARRSERS